MTQEKPDEDDMFAIMQEAQVGGKAEDVPDAVVPAEPVAEAFAVAAPIAEKAEDVAAANALRAELGVPPVFANTEQKKFVQEAGPDKVKDYIDKLNASAESGEFYPARGIIQELINDGELPERASRDPNLRKALTAYYESSYKRLMLLEDHRNKQYFSHGQNKDLPQEASDYVADMLHEIDNISKRKGFDSNPYAGGNM